MAQNDEKTSKIDVPEAVLYRAKSEYISDYDVHRTYIQGFDAYEAMLIGEVYDSVSKSVDNTKITDSYATTLARERADRVMAKLPDGTTEPVGSADVGKAAFMDILRQKWVYPNANAQHPFHEKLNMVQFYSSVYGYMPVFIDWNVTPQGYAGPDMWLWNPRLFVPQQGRTSIADMDHATGLTYVSKVFLKDVIATVKKGDDSGGWSLEALELLYANCDQTYADDLEFETKVARDRAQSPVKKGILLATRYEAGMDGRWVTFAPEHGYIQVRSLKNPHKNGRIPFVAKYSQPLFDSFYGLGDFQRAKPLQFARDGLTNFYFKGIKMNLIPPIVANANGVLPHTLDYREGGVMLETIPNSIRRLETSTAGLATFQAAQDSLTGSLLGLYGSQNAAIAAGNTNNPSQGKTPQAIDLYVEKEATRDGADRRHLEAFIEQVTDMFMELIVNVGTETIPVGLFADDIKSIEKAGMADISELFRKVEANEQENAGVLRINPDKLKGVAYRFHIKPDSTAKANKSAMLKTIFDFAERIAGMQNVFKDDHRLIIHWEKITQAMEELSDIPGASEFIEFKEDAEPPKPQPSATAVPVPSGQVVESADLVKMYLATADVAVQGQIMELLGFQPSGPSQAPEPEPEAPAPTATKQGTLFQDPDLAHAADAINDMSGPEIPETPEPTVGPGGTLFQDPTLGKAAAALQAM